MYCVECDLHLAESNSDTCHGCAVKLAKVEQTEAELDRKQQAEADESDRLYQEAMDRDEDLRAAYEDDYDWSY